ncbi:MAG: hypothetical protein HYV09_34655 [Deltaproteobacteria bacterium]|nr:hypothetical protein [Deltaproteobacteria bacterium]
MIAIVTGLGRAFAIGAVVLSGCTAHERAPLRAAPEASGDRVGAARVSAIPDGWMRIEPSHQRFLCATYANDVWHVAPDKGVVRLTREFGFEDGRGPPVPFVPQKFSQKFSGRGRRHALAIGGGFLVGVDIGEWGGGLYWFEADGTGERELGDENVHGLVALGPDEALSLEGLAHEIPVGSVRWIQRHNGVFGTAAVTQLPGTPEVHVATAGVVFTLTSYSLVRLSEGRRVTVLQPLPGSRPRAQSMAADANGALWVGMRHFVLRLTPDGDRFTESWLVPKGCRRAELIDGECVCEGT